MSRADLVRQQRDDFAAIDARARSIYHRKERALPFALVYQEGYRALAGRELWDENALNYEPEETDTWN